MSYDKAAQWLNRVRDGIRTPQRPVAAAVCDRRRMVIAPWTQVSSSRTAPDGTRLAFPRAWRYEKRLTNSLALLYTHNAILDVRSNLAFKAR